MICIQNACKSGRKVCTRAECINAPSQHPLIGWIRREVKASAQIKRWFITYRKSGFTRARSLVLAWKTTRPIHSARNIL